MSKIEVDAIDKQSGSTLTLGGSGTAVTLACGATQTGFGRTGTVDWVTTIQTSTPFTAVSGKGYFINTTSGAITMNLPSSPSAGDIVSFKDYARTFQTNSLTVGRGGSNMDGIASDSEFSTEGLSATLIYMDATKGWSLINDDATTKVGAAFIAATVSGACNTLVTAPCCSNVKIATFLGPGTFCVSNAGNAGGSNTVDYLVIAGGGSSSQGGGSYNGAGGGAGGYRFSTGAVSGCYSAGPGPLGASAVPVTATAFPITVGAGAARVPGDNEQPGLKGADSVFSTVTSAGGGAGRNSWPAIPSGPDTANGGSGGGGAAPWQGSPTSVPGGAGNTPSVSPPQGNPGGATPTNNNAGGGGGGAGAVGGNAPGASTGGNGGDGLASSITGSAVTRGGGGGGAGAPTVGAGGAGGGGAGGTVPNTSGTAGTANTGGGGGGGAAKSAPGSVTSYNAAGGSGIVIIRYKFQ